MAKKCGKSVELIPKTARWEIGAVRRREARRRPA